MSERTAADLRLKRAAALLFLMLCLLAWPLCPLAEAVSPLEERLSALALVDQMNSRYRAQTYRYYKERFSVRGCGPASLTNTLGVILNLRNQAETDSLLLEIMRLMALENRPATWPISIDDQSLLLTAGMADYPKVFTLLRGLGVPAVSYNEQLTMSSFQAWISGRNLNGGLLLMARMRMGEQWEDVISICRWLEENGFGQALLLGYFMSAGTSANFSPFGSDSGHYVTACFQAESYIRDGTLYLIDSYQKALTTEEQDGVVYKEVYRLANQGLSPFKQTYAFSHLNPLVIRLTMKEEPLNALHESMADPAAELKYRLNCLRFVELYGYGGVMLYIPAGNTLPGGQRP